MDVLFLFFWVALWVAIGLALGALMLLVWRGR
jgi:hypothetical protein